MPVIVVVAVVVVGFVSRSTRFFFFTLVVVFVPFSLSLSLSLYLSLSHTLLPRIPSPVITSRIQLLLFARTFCAIMRGTEIAGYTAVTRRKTINDESIIIIIIILLRWHSICLSLKIEREICDSRTGNNIV